MYTSTTALGLVAALAAPAAAFFRMTCPGRIVTERADPLITPGGVSGHVHTISGGNGFDFSMDYADARASTCSSCAIKQDLSNYWTPKLYYQYQNGSFEDVPQVGDGPGVQAGMTVYYLQRPGPKNDALKAFPEGFRMIAGDPFKRSGTSDFASQAVSFVCLDYSGTSPQTRGMPAKNCPDGLRAQIFFPSCWDGVNLDSPDHKSHMAYPESGAADNGPCPASHPVHMVSLFYEVLYNVNHFADKWYGSGQPFLFAQGDTTGYGFHGDFVNGWDVNVLQSAVDECTNLSGDLADCPVLDLFTTKESQACIVPPRVQETVTGVLDKLPGCNPVTSGPDAAAIITNCADVPAIGAYPQYFTDVTGSLGYEYIGCGTDSVGGRTLSAASESTSTMDVETCVSFCSGKGYTYAGLEYSSQCYCGNTVATDRAPVTGVLGNCFSACSGNSTQYCGGASALSLYKKCDGGSCTNAAYTGPSGSGVVVAVGSSAASSSSSSSSAPASSSSSSAAAATSSPSAAATSTSASSSSTSTAAVAATTATSSQTSTTTTTSTTRTRTRTRTSSTASATVTIAGSRKQKTWTRHQRARIAKNRAAQHIAERQAIEVKAKLADEA